LWRAEVEIRVEIFVTDPSKIVYRSMFFNPQLNATESDVLYDFSGETKSLGYRTSASPRFGGRRRGESLTS
jgi:hypothetical protein